MSNVLDDLDLFVRDITPNQAQVYVRLPWPDGTRAWRLVGKVRGPWIEGRATLPASAPLQDLGSSPASLSAAHLLARATIVDPCPWSPDVPSLYKLTVELEREGLSLATAEREFGLRDLRPQKRNLYFNGKAWVLRGVHGDLAATAPTDWKTASAVCVTETIDEAWFNEASKVGAMVVVRLDNQEDVNVQQFRWLARFTSVAMVVLPNPAKLPDDVRLFAPNLLLAQIVSAGQRPASWAHVAWLELTAEASIPEEVGGLDLPIIAVRRRLHGSLSEARAACDTLQADLAPLGQFAGYVV